jgi:hypothetical protein
MSLGLNGRNVKVITHLQLMSRPRTRIASARGQLHLTILYKEVRYVRFGIISFLVEWLTFQILIKEFSGWNLGS